MSEQHSNPMPSKMDNDGLDVRWLWHTIYLARKAILLSMLVAALLSAGLSLLLPNIYQAEILLAPVESAGSKSTSSSILSSLGGMAALAGVSVSGGSTEENLAVLQSKIFLWQFVQQNGLMPFLFADKWDQNKKRWKSDEVAKQPGQWDVYRLLVKGNKLMAIAEKKTGLVRVTVEWRDPNLAAKMANDVVEQLNIYLASQAIVRSERNLKYLHEALARTQVEEVRKVLFDMIASEEKNAMMASAKKEFAFKILDPAVVPDKKIKPARSLIVLMCTFLVGILVSVFTVFRAKKIPQ